MNPMLTDRVTRMNVVIDLQFKSFHLYVYISDIYKCALQNDNGEK